jgi:ribonuclease G
MNKELIINAAPQGVEIALLEDKKLVELHNEKSDARFAVGDLYLGKVSSLYRFKPLCQIPAQVHNYVYAG